MNFSEKHSSQLLLLAALGSVLCSFVTLAGQGESGDQSCDPETDPNCYLRLRLASHPPELPAGRTIVSLERLSNWGLVNQGCTNDQGVAVPSVVNQGGPSSIIAVLVGLFAPGVLDVTSSEGLCGFGFPVQIPSQFPVLPSAHGDQPRHVIFAGSEANNIQTDVGDDMILARGGADMIGGGRFGDAGNDLLVGGVGDDSILGGDGDDTIRGDSGNDQLRGGAENDMILGGSGDDRLFGGLEGMLSSDGDADQISGEIGNDLIVGGGGKDTLRGGEGDDTIFAELEEGFSPDGSTLAGYGPFPSPLGFKVTFDIRIDGGTGNDNLFGGSGRDTIRGGPGNDTIVGNPGADRLLGGGGNDQIFADGFESGDVSANVVAPGPVDWRPGTYRLVRNREVDLIVPGRGTEAGAAQIVSNRPIGAVVRFAVENQGIAVVPEGDLYNSILIPVTQESAMGLATGFALFNLGGDEELTLTLSQLDGTPIGSRQRLISGDGHISIFVDEMFLGLSDFRGILRIDGGLLSGAAIQMGSQPGQFTTLPVIPGDLTASEDPLIFAQFGNGSGFTSSIFLINSSNTTATGRVEFFDDAGNPLDNGLSTQGSAGTPQFNIPPGGGAVLETDGAGDLVVGSARVILQTGVVGGVLRFAFPGIGLAGVGISPSVEGAIVPVRRSASAGLSTGIALAAESDGVLVNCTLRKPDGEEVVGGIVEINLAANGHAARFLEELFPGVDTSEFEGTLTLESSNGARFASAAIELGRSAGEFTTLVTEEIRVLRQP